MKNATALAVSIRPNLGVVAIVQEAMRYAREVAKKRMSIPPDSLHGELDSAGGVEQVGGDSRE